MKPRASAASPGRELQCGAMCVLLVGCALWGSLSGCTRIQNRAAPPPPVPKVEATIELTGSGLDRPTTFTFAQLAARPSVRLTNVLMQKTHSDDELTSWEGPTMDSLLAEVQIRPGRMKVSLEARDGYDIETTLESLKDAVIALKDGEGRWLAERHPPGYLRLVPPHKPGNFWMVNLCRIQVEPMDGPPTGL